MPELAQQTPGSNGGACASLGCTCQYGYPTRGLDATELAAARQIAAATGQPILVVEVEVEPAEPEPELEL